MNRKNHKGKQTNNRIGYIKFVDNKYIDSYFSISSLWFSNIDLFREASKSNGDLINDKNEGRYGDVEIDMPIYISCYTILTANSFDDNGYLKDSFIKPIIKSEDSLDKKRGFIYIPVDNMNNLTEIISKNTIAESKADPKFKRHSFFAKTVKYEDESLKDRLWIIQTFRRWNAGIFLKDLIYEKDMEKVGHLCIVTKPLKYKAQHEYRLGLVFPEQKKDDRASGKELSFKAPDADDNHSPSFDFATQKFEKCDLYHLSLSQLQKSN